MFRVKRDLLGFSNRRSILSSGRPRPDRRLSAIFSDTARSVSTHFSHIAVPHSRFVGAVLLLNNTEKRLFVHLVAMPNEKPHSRGDRASGANQESAYLVMRAPWQRSITGLTGNNPRICDLIFVPGRDGIIPRKAPVAPRSRAVLAFGRLPSPAASLARRCCGPFIRTDFADQLSKRVGTVECYLDHPLEGDGSICI